MVNHLLDGPYLTSLSIYDFDLDDHVLMILDFDFIFPQHDVVLPPGAYAIKQIGKQRVGPFGGWIHHFDKTAESMETSRRLPWEGAEVTTHNHQVLLNVYNRNGLTFSPVQPAVLSLKYKIFLEAEGPHLLYAGAIQPSDYRDFKTYFSQAIPDERVTKTIVITSRSKSPYSIRYFDGADPLGFPAEKIPLQSANGYFDQRFEFPLIQPILTSRAFYFAVATAWMKEQTPRTPYPVEILEETA